VVDSVWAGADWEGADSEAEGKVVATSMIVSHRQQNHKTGVSHWFSGPSWADRWGPGLGYVIVRIILEDFLISI
jgi:hypothetical protein